VADGKPYVTEMDLRHSLIPDDLIDDLLSSMPAHNGPDMEADRNVPKYDYISFMQGMIGDAQHDSRQANGSGGGRTNGVTTPTTPRW
jgi:hypothetical protein